MGPTWADVKEAQVETRYPRIACKRERVSVRSAMAKGGREKGGRKSLDPSYSGWQQ